MLLRNNLPHLHFYRRKKVRCTSKTGAVYVSIREEIEMDIRIGAKSPVYGSRPTSRVTDSSLKTSFAMMMVKERSISQGSATSSKSPAAKTGSINQDTVTISGNDLTQRLDSVYTC